MYTIAKIAGWKGYIGALITGGLGLIFSLIGISHHASRKFGKTAGTQQACRQAG
jgi:hypothetical protein